MFIDSISSGLTSIISMVGSTTTALINGELSGLMSVVGLCIAMGILGFAIRTIKSLVWGF